MPTGTELVAALRVFIEEHIPSCKRLGVTPDNARKAATFLNSRGYAIEAVPDAGFWVTHPNFPEGVPRGTAIPEITAAIKHGLTPDTIAFLDSKDSVKGLQNERVACYQNVQHYTDNANKCSEEIKKAVHTYIIKNRRDIRYVGNHTRTPDDLYISAMECVQSPTGTCVYDAQYDCEKQTCLFCGLPDAR